MSPWNEGEELRAAGEVLADGEWVNGMVVLREMMAAIPPGQAQRIAMTQAKGDPAKLTTAELIARGRRSRARRALADVISRGRYVVDTENGKLTRAHWQGNLPWRIRNPHVGQMSVAQAADELDVPEHVLRVWIGRGYVPQPSTNPSGYQVIRQEEMPIYRKVREIWPGLHSMTWPVDPRSVWSQPKDAGFVCPHCKTPLSITIVEVG